MAAGRKRERERVGVAKEEEDVEEES